MGNTNQKIIFQSIKKKTLIIEQQYNQIKSMQTKKIKVFHSTGMIPTKIRINNEKKIDSKMLNASPVFLNNMETSSGKQKPFQNPDKRKQVQNNKFPYSAIGYLVVCFKKNDIQGQFFFGTAYLIAHNIAITAAHNIYSRKKQKFVTYCSLILGEIQKNAQEFIVSYAYVPQGYVDDQASEKKFLPIDYALLILEKTQKLGEFYGALSIAPFTDQKLQQKIIIDISGYPKDKNFEKNQNEKSQNLKKITTMFGCQQTIKYLKNNMFFYDQVHTNQGQSGSPIITFKRQQNQQKQKLYPKVIGIHTGGDDQINHGVIITPEMIQKMKNWVFDFQRKSNQCHKIPFSNDNDNNQINNFILSYCQDLFSDSIDEIQYGQQEKKRIDEKMGNNSKQKTLIDLYRSQISLLDLKYLIKQKINREKIQKLRLSFNQICDDGISQLCLQQYKWSQLYILNIDSNNISMNGVKYLSRAAQMKCFPELKQLWLGANKIGSNKQINKINENKSEQQEAILFKFTNIQILSLWQNKINDDDMKILFGKKSKNENANNNKEDNQIFHHLQKLYLDDNKISEKGIKRLVSHKNAFNNLKQLSLMSNVRIQDKGIHYFMKSCHNGAFPLLALLDIRNINMSDNGINEFAKEEYKYTFDSKNQQSLRSIKKIDCRKNELIKNKIEAKKKLEKRFKKNQTLIEV